MRVLKLVGIEKVSKLQQPDEPAVLSLNSPATDIYTDFHKQTPVVIDGSAAAVDVEEQMLRAHVKLNIVIDGSGEFLGVIRLGDLGNDHIIRAVAGGIPREDVQVSDLMQARPQLRALPESELHSSTVGDVLLTLQNAGIQHCLVVDDAGERICGLISASDVARRLKLPLSIHKAPSFAEIYAVVSESHLRGHRTGT